MGNCKSKEQEENCDKKLASPSDRQNNKYQAQSQSNHETSAPGTTDTSNLMHQGISEEISCATNNIPLKSSPIRNQSSPELANSDQKPDGAKRRIMSNDDVIDDTRAEVNSLLDQIHEFQGTSENDKSYRYLDEMLTRCILKLDNIQCNNDQDRSNRKEAIKGVNEAIAILERKLEINVDIDRVESNLKSAPKPES